MPALLIACEGELGRARGAGGAGGLGEYVPAVACILGVLETPLFWAAGSPYMFRS